MMVVSISEFKTNMDKYLELATEQDIFITKDGKNIAMITSPTVNKLPALDSLIGIVSESSDIDIEAIRDERLARQ